MKNKTTSKIYLLGEKIGLTKEDINTALLNLNKKPEQIYFSNGPPWYPGGRYGTISINEFQI